MMKEREHNIFIIGSPWHAIIAESLSNDEDIYLIEFSTEANLASIKNTIKNKDKVLISVDGKIFFFSNAIKNFFTNFKQIKKEFRAIKNKLLGLKAEKIYVFNLNSQFSINCINLIKNKKIVKVEDGVCDYLSFSLKQEGKTIRKIKSYISKLFGLDKIHFPNPVKEDESYFFFPERAPKKFANKKNLHLFRDLIIEKLHAQKAQIMEVNNKDVLVIGQTMFEDKYCSLADEMQIYLSIAKKMKSIGCNNIFFKPHPRTSSKKLNILNNYENRSFIKLLRSDFMVEEILAKHNFAYVLGMWSNPVIYSRPLFNVESYSLIPSLLELKRNNFLYRIHNEMTNTFPEFYRDFREIN